MHTRPRYATIRWRLAYVVGCLMLSSSASECGPQKRKRTVRTVRKQCLHSISHLYPFPFHQTQTHNNRYKRHGKCKRSPDLTSMAGDAAAGVAPAATARKRRIVLTAAVCGLALVLGLAIGKPGRQSHQHPQPSSDVVSPSLPQAAAEDKASVNTTDTASLPSTTTANTSAGSASPATNIGPVASAVGNLWSSLTSALTTSNINKQGITDPYLGTPDGSEASFISIPFCTPRNTTQLEILVEESVCPVITLLPNTTYVLDHYITVSRPVTIVGRPLGMPTIDGHGTFRIFMVLPGGRLDLRYVRLYKGRARLVVPDLLYVLQGAIVYIRRGGAAAMTGCHVTIHPSTRYTNVGISRNIRATTLILGGGVYVEGGIFRATGCVYASWRPGIIYRETYFIGNEFLVMTGDVFITGCIFSMVQVFSNTIGVGGFVFNVAGIVALTGCIFNSNTMFLSAVGMGYVCFNQGAVILTGNINNLQAAFAAFWGGGLGVWNGGGVLTMTGMVSNAEGIMSAGAGLGFQAGCGGGVVIRTGMFSQSVFLSFPLLILSFSSSLETYSLTFSLLPTTYPFFLPYTAFRVENKGTSYKVSSLKAEAMQALSRVLLASIFTVQGVES